MKKKPLTDEQRAECAALKLLFEKRQRELRAQGKKISQYSVADLLGVSQGAVNQVLNGSNVITLQGAIRWSEILGAPISSFSPRLAMQAQMIAESAATGIPSMGGNDSMAAGDDLSIQKREQPHAISLQNAKRIGVRSFAQILSKAQGTEYMIVFGDYPPAVFGYRLESDHMEGEPTYIKKGSMLLINPELAPIEGDVILVNVSGHPAIGIFERVGDKCLAVATRYKIPAIEISPDQVLGVVLESIVSHKNPARPQ